MIKSNKFRIVDVSEQEIFKVVSGGVSRESCCLLVTVKGGNPFRPEEIFIGYDMTDFECRNQCVARKPECIGPMKCSDEQNLGGCFKVMSSLSSFK